MITEHAVQGIKGIKTIHKYSIVFFEFEYEKAIKK